MAKGKTDSSGGDAPLGDNIRLAEAGQSLFVKAAGVGVAAMAVSVFLGSSENDGWSRFSHSYLVALIWVFTIGAGAVWWLTLQHIVNAHWSIAIRRVGELFAASAPVIFLLALPVTVPLIMGKAIMYRWADSALMVGDLHDKVGYLNTKFFAIRLVFYFGFLTWLSYFFLKNSLKQDKQDKTGALKTLLTMRRVGGPAMIVYAIVITFSSIDLIMTLEPQWFSTMFGIYYFASCVMSIHAALALSLMWLQSKGKLKSSVTADHYHDLGKMLFAFTVFWAYVGFSQFMLQWYANMPEETMWWKERFANSWGTLSWVLLFGHFVIPFFGLLSRWVKRSRKGLAFWCIWQLVMVYVDMYWLVMPTVSNEIPFKLIDLTCWLGVGSLFVAGIAYSARNIDLIAKNDPRLADSLAFENV